MQYLQSKHYIEHELEKILNKKIIITMDHVKNIKFDYFKYDPEFNIIKLFEKYGYVFTNEICITLINKDAFMISDFSDDKKTDEICKIAVQSKGLLLEYIDRKSTRLNSSH